MIKWNQKQKETTCKDCSDPALSICTKSCLQPFCCRHGIAHNLTLLVRVKLLSEEEEQMILQYQAKERPLLFEEKTPEEKDAAICYRCSAGQQRSSIDSLSSQLVALSFFALLVSTLVLALALQVIGEASCLNGLRLYPGGKCFQKQNTTQDIFLLQQEFINQASCFFRRKPRSEEEWSYVTMCECYDVLQTFDIESRSCVRRSCSAPLFKARDGSCKSRGAFVNQPKYQFRNARDCPMYTRYWEEGESCQSPNCDNPTYIVTEHGGCHQCPPYYKRFGNECYELGRISDKFKAATFVRTALKFEVQPSLRIKPCPKDENGLVVPFNDSLGQLQCVLPSSISSTSEASQERSGLSDTEATRTRRPCSLHEVLNRFTLNCSFSCPPFQRFNYIAKACEDFSCQPSEYWKGRDGACHRCLIGEVRIGEECIELKAIGKS